MAMMKEKGAIYTPQALIFELPSEEVIANLSPAIVAKGRPLVDNLDSSMKLAQKHGVLESKPVIDRQLAKDRCWQKQ